MGCFDSAPLSTRLSLISFLVVLQPAIAQALRLPLPMPDQLKNVQGVAKCLERFIQVALSNLLCLVLQTQYRPAVKMHHPKALGHVELRLGRQSIGPSDVL